MERIISNAQELQDTIDKLADILKSKVAMDRADAQLILDMIDELKNCRDAVKSHAKVGEIITKLYNYDG